MSYDKQCPETIQTMFADIAAGYDRCNNLMSMTLFRRWNRRLVNGVLVPQQPRVFVDLCAGTGDIAFGYLQKLQKANQPLPEVHLIDFCPQMLDVAREKAKCMHLGNASITFTQGDAQEIPLPDRSVDCVTIAYGIRNVADPAKCIRDVYRILHPGGRLGILELTRPNNAILKMGHTLYLKTVLPLLGRWVTSNQEAYQYLCNSIQSFIPVHELQQIYVEAGFQEIRATPLYGGIATIVEGRK